MTGVLLREMEKDTTMTNDIKAIENKFVDAMGSGVGAGAKLAELVKNAITSQDGRHLASAIARLGTKGDTQGVTAVRSIVGAVFDGAKIKTAKDKKTIVLSLKDAVVDVDAAKRLDEAVAKKLSIRSTMVKQVKGDTEKKALDLPDYAAKLVKRMNKDGVTKAALIAAIQAA